MSIREVAPRSCADSTTGGIQEAIDALPSSGGTVFVHAGTYALRRSVTLRAGVTLRGEGAATVLTRPRLRTFPLARRTRRELRRIVLDSATGLRVGDEIYIRDNVSRGWNGRHAIVKAIRGETVSVESLSGTPDRIFSPARDAAADNTFPAISAPKAHGAVVADLCIDGRKARARGVVPDFTSSAVHADGAEPGGEGADAAAGGRFV